MPPSSAAISLRESFGDRKPPDISRKITACVACRKQKLKCHMNGQNPPCTRCKTRGLSCTVNKSLQMLLENEVEWKEEIERRMRKVEEACKIANQQEDLTSSTLESQTTSSTNSPQNVDSSEHDNRSLYQASENKGNVTLNLSCGLGAFPGSSVISLTGTEYGAQPSRKPDLITHGIISLEAAEEYFTIYRKCMEPCLYQILAEDECLASVRGRSSFLTAAICAVGSFSRDSVEHQKCYDVFIKEVSSRLFSRTHDYDDVQALCIGAFWLSKVSSTLVGMAVRIANDLNLHRCITKMPHVKRECYERTRLYFLVYVCDHHCSLIYGKPPMTRDFRSLRSPKAFLQSDHCYPEDQKLISQVELWSISSRVFDIFGADTEASINSERIAELYLISDAFDACRSGFGAILIDDNLGEISRQISELYINCAKLSLFSHAFRGSSKSRTTSSAALTSMQNFGRRALESALAIIRSVAWGNEIQGRLESLPSYFGTMIAFASVSLLKAWGKEPAMAYLDANEVSSALNRLVEVFQACSARVQVGHPIRSVARSLKIALDQNCHSNMDHFGFRNTLDTSMFDLDTIGSNSIGLDWLGGYNSLFPFPDEHSLGFPHLQNYEGISNT